MMYDLRRDGKSIDEVTAEDADEALEKLLEKFPEDLEEVDFFAVNGGWRSMDGFEIIPEKLW